MAPVHSRVRSEEVGPPGGRPPSLSGRRRRRGWRCPCARGSVAAFGSASRRSSAPRSGREGREVTQKTPRDTRAGRCSREIAERDSRAKAQLAPCSGARRAGRSSRSRHAAACGRCPSSRRQIARVAVRGSHGKRPAEAAASGGGGMGGSDSEAEEKGERRRCGSAHTLLASARKGRRQRRSPRRRGGRRGHPLMEPVDASRLVDVSRWACAGVAEASWWCSRPRQAAKA